MSNYDILFILFIITNIIWYILGNIFFYKSERYYKKSRELEKRIDKAVELIYNYQMNDKDNVNYKELLFFLIY